jgi:AmiR/NasT family two-component response regulator
MMAAHHIGSDEAFEVLRKASNDMNMKLTEVAREVIENAERRPLEDS